MLQVSEPRCVNKVMNQVCCLVAVWLSRTGRKCGFELEIPPTTRRSLEYYIGNPQSGLRHELCGIARTAEREVLRSGGM